MGSKFEGWYRWRIKGGLEACRGCSVVRLARGQDGWEGLGLGHIRARALGGSDEPDNLTIVCGPCDRVMGARDWTGLFEPLTAEPLWAEFLAFARRQSVERRRVLAEQHEAQRRAQLAQWAQLASGGWAEEEALARARATRPGT